MALSVTHATQTVVADDPAYPVGSDEWNAAHSLSGTLDVANGGTGASTAAGARTALGLGTAAVENTGTSGSNVPKLDGANTWGAAQTIPGVTNTGAETISGDISPAQITADQNNYAPTGFATAAVLRLSTDASRTITGLAGGADGRRVTILNVGSQNLVLANLSGSSTAANQFSLGSSQTIPAGGGVNLWYDATDSVWRMAHYGGTGTGDVVGPASATDNAIARFDLATGKLIQNSGVTIDDSGNIAAGTTPSLGIGTIELGHATDTTIARSAPGKVSVEGVAVRLAGRETIWIPAKAMTSRLTNGPSTGLVEMATNKNMFNTLDFDTTTQEFAQFSIKMPKSWDLGTVAFVPVWSHAATTVNFGVAFGLAGIAISDNEAGDVAFGTAQTSVDTGGTTNNIYHGPESSAITIAGTPAALDYVMFQINRTVADAGDTMAIDARLHGVHLYYSTNAANDT